MEVHAIISASKTPNPTGNLSNHRKPILEAIRVMYNNSRKTNILNESTDFEINDNYMHSQQDYQDLQKVLLFLFSILTINLEN